MKEENNKIGRPLKFKSVKELQTAIDAYFKKCDGRIVEVFDKNSGSVVKLNNPEPYTVSGLAMALDCDRVTLLNYEKKDKEFFSTIKRAKSKIEYCVERGSLESGKPVGYIFNLKNNFKQWKDKTESDVNMNSKSVVFVSKADTKEADKHIKKMVESD